MFGRSYRHPQQFEVDQLVKGFAAAHDEVAGLVAEAYYLASRRRPERAVLRVVVAALSPA